MQPNKFIMSNIEKCLVVWLIMKFLVKNTRLRMIFICNFLLLHYVKLCTKTFLYLIINGLCILPTKKKLSLIVIYDILGNQMTP